MEVISHFESGTALAKQAAKDLAERITELSLKSDQVNIVLTGGTVGIQTLEELAPLLAQSDLSKVHFWWGDERFLESGSSDRNELQAHNALLSKISIPSANLHPFPSSDEDDIEVAANEFAEGIANINPKFDVVLLGMGPDGHVASLFPNSSPRFINDWVVMETNSPKPPSERLSLSYQALNSAKEVWFVVAGADKSAAVKEVFTDKLLPAALVRGIDKTRWYLDQAAAQEITS
jgi:6-phosphogluconolactonase